MDRAASWVTVHGVAKNWTQLKSWLIGKDPDAGRVWGQEEKGMTEDEMAGWHHQLNGHEFEWTPGVGDGQGGLLLLLSRFSRVRLCVTPQTAAHQAPPFLGFSRQEHWSGLPFPSPGVLQFMGLQRVGHDWATDLIWTQNCKWSGSDMCALLKKTKKERKKEILWVLADIPAMAREEVYKTRLMNGKKNKCYLWILPKTYHLYKELPLP